MLFTSFEFIFLFLPIVLIGYFLLTKFNFSIAKLFLVLSSLFFYSWWNIAYLPLLLGSIIFNYLYSKLLNSKQSKFLLSLGIIVNVLVLGYFKYMDFFITNVNSLFSTNVQLLHLLLPLGISFFTFQQIAYLVDSYRKENKDYSLVDYSLFISFFPQLIAGPIVYHKEMLPQFENDENRRISIQNIATGTFIFVLGLFKKVGIADTFAKWANLGFDNSADLSFIESWITSLSYTMQLYFDFSGYSDMAIGLALIFNIRLPLNFDSPYKSLSIQEFWRRWHMTLNKFLTTYLYFPLGGSRKGIIRTYINILIIFAVSGVWHGAGWTFIIWGMLHGIASCINRLWSKFGFRLPTFFAWFLTFNFVNIAWVFFRATSVNQAIEVLTSMFNINNLLSTNYLTDQFIHFHTPTEFLGISFSLVYFITFMMIACLIIALFAKNTWELSQLRFNSPIGAVYVAAIITITTYIVFSNFSSSEFIYFNF